MHDITAVRNRTRFDGPSAQPFTVDRPHLDRLYDSAVGQVIRVLAPAGYGKSIQVAHWMTSETRQVGWVDLEVVDNDPFVLLGAIERTLTRVTDFPGARLPVSARDTDDFLSRVLPEFRTLVHGCRAPFVLVLDDVHHVRARDAGAVLDALADSLPQGATLVLCGRAHHTESIGRLRLHPGVDDITVEELALAGDEARQMLALLDVDLPSEDLRAVVDRFEGWPAGLRLLAIVLRGGGFVGDVPAAGGRSRVITDFLSAEWIGQLGSDDVALLREAACLERFTGAMCDGVLGRRGSAADLRRLHDDELLLLPLDQRDEWFRMHRLLASWLEWQLREDDPDRWRAVHLAAAGWLADHGDVDLAIDHVMVAEDLQAAESLVIASAPHYITGGLHATVRRWLDGFPHDHVLASPGLCAVGAVEGLHRGDGARALHWHRLLLASLPGNGPGVRSPAADVADALRIALEVAPASTLLPIGLRVRRRLGPGEWHAFACWSLGGLHFLSGEPEAGLEAAEAGAFEAELVDARFLHANCLATVAAIEHLTGVRGSRPVDGTDPWQIVLEARGHNVPTTAIAAAMHALGRARAGEVDTARDVLVLARGHLDGFHTISPWFNVITRLVLADVALLLHDLAMGRRLLVEVERVLAVDMGADGAIAAMAALRARLETAAVVDGADALTGAEAKVLQFLPTNLTLGDIGTRLFVSRNTVKTHVAAIYRKLGASTRSEAVELARSSGILDRLDGPVTGP